MACANATGILRLSYLRSGIPSLTPYNPVSFASSISTFLSTPTGVPVRRTVPRVGETRHHPRMESSRNLSVQANDTKKVLNVVAISGSIWKNSTTTGLLRAVAAIAKSSRKMEIEILDISTFPLMNEDLETRELYPAAIGSAKEKIISADAVLFASPEYNY